MYLRIVRVVGLISLVSITVFLLIIGIGAGLCQKWMLMIFFLFAAVLSVLSFTCSLFALKVERCFRHLGHLISEESNSERQITTASNHNSIRRVNKVTGKTVMKLSVISTVVYFSLWIIAYLHQNWFWAGVLMFVWIITDIIFREILMALKIDTCSRRLKELISKNKEGKASKEQSGE